MSPRALKDQLLSTKVNPIKWAKVTGGTVTTYTKATGEVMEVHTFTADSNLVVVTPGYAEVLLVGGGGSTDNSGNYGGNGGDIIRGVHALPAGTHAVTVGAGGTTATSHLESGGRSSIGTVLATTTAGRTFNEPGIGAGGTSANPRLGLTSSITGSAVEYSRASSDNPPAANTGFGTNFSPGASGIVIVAVRI